MLIITRRAGEAVNIGDKITVTVLAKEGGGLRLGIDAPRDVKVLRSELAKHDTAGGIPAPRTSAAHGKG